MPYDSGKFGVITRHVFGLTRKHGGQATNLFSGPVTGVATFSAEGYGFGTTDATTVTQLARWYPRGPITMVKAGSFVLATITNASNDLIQAKLLTRGASASTGCTWYVKSTSTAVAPYTRASTETFTVRQVKAGEYISIKTGTPKTDKGTAANTATTTGTIAFFIDYVPSWDLKHTIDTHV
jgi:hypothetical protein